MNIFNKIKADIKEAPFKRVVMPLVILLIGFLARVWWIRTIPTDQLYDFDAYYRIAKNIFEGKGFTYEGAPIAFQGMFYSWSLGMLFKVFGTASVGFAKWFNVIYGTLTIALVYKIVLKMTIKNENANALALVTMAITAFLPHHIAYCSTTGTEIQMAFLLALLIYIQVSDLNDKWKYPLLGVLTGICALTKPFYLAYPVIIGFSEWMMNKNLKRSAIKGLLVWMVMAAVISPWTYRNYKAFGRFIPVSYNSGFNLYINNNPNNVHGGWMSFEDLYKTDEIEAIIDTHLENGNKSIKLASDIEVDLKPHAVQWIKENPEEFAKLGLIRVHSTYFNGAWDIDAWTMNRLADKPTELTTKEVERNRNAFRALNDILLSVLSGFSLVFIMLGIPPVFMSIVSPKRKLDQSIVLLFMNLAFPSIVFFVYEGQPRYNQSLLFLMIIVVVLTSDKIKKMYQSN